VATEETHAPNRLVLLALALASRFQSTFHSLSEEEREAARAKRIAQQEKQRDDDAGEQNQP